MASQTKVEPNDSTPPSPVSGVAASSGFSESEQTLGEGAREPASQVESLVASAEQPGDDEDVSLDELMMSGEEEDDEPDEATEVQGMLRLPPLHDEDEPRDLAPVDAADDPLTGPVAADAGAAGAVDAHVTSDEVFGVASLEEDEAAALAAAAEAQEEAARAAEAESEARRTAELVAHAPLEEVAAVAPPTPPERISSVPGARTSSVPPASEPSSGSPVAEVVPAPAEAVAQGEGDDTEPPMSVDFEPPADESVASSPLGDDPLPSFDIPEPELPAVAALAADVQVQSRNTPRPMSALPQLSEVAEDEDEVTHIGLPVVPETPSAEYAAVGAAAFSVAEPSVTGLPGFDADLSLADARRATTRVVPRIDPAELARRRLASDPGASRAARRGPLGTWLSGVFQRYRPEPALAAGAPPVPSRRRAGWLVDTVLPPLSLVLFGSGIGAGIMLLQPDRGAKAAQQVQTVQALRDVQKRPTTLAERAEAGDGDALFKITNMSPNERSSALTLALERGYQTQRQNEFKEFARTLETPAGLSTPNLTTRFLNYATSPETMLAAFSHLLSWPGSTGPDVLYNVWEKAPGGSRAASLAQQLLHSADQRAKATPALITALDLRTATTCDDYLRVLPAVKKDGDQRCSATLRALKHKDGCGDDGKQDCFACLREGSLLDDALSAIEGRSAPQL